MSAVTALTPSTHKVPCGTVPCFRRTGPCSGPVSQRKLDHGHGSPTFTTTRRPVRTILPAVAAATVLPSFRDVSVPSGRYAVRAMIPDKKFGKIFNAIQNNMF